MLVTAPLIWLVLASALLLLAVFGLDTDGLLLVIGVSALLLTLLTSLLPAPAVGQAVIFALLVVAGYGTLRRVSASREARSIPPAARAETAEVILGFDADGRGRVLWQGQSWAALNLQPDLSLPAGSQVSVMGREGTELRVLPR